jgi:hypothetical protein
MGDTVRPHQFSEKVLSFTAITKSWVHSMVRRVIRPSALLSTATLVSGSSLQSRPCGSKPWIPLPAVRLAWKRTTLTLPPRTNFARNPASSSSNHLPFDAQVPQNPMAATYTPLDAYSRAPSPFLNPEQMHGTPTPGSTTPLTLPANSPVFLPPPMFQTHHHRHSSSMSSGPFLQPPREEYES